MYLIAKFDDHRSNRNIDKNYFINSNMGTLEKAEVTTSIRHIGRFLKSGIPIQNSEVQDTASRKSKTRRRRIRRTQTIAKCYTFHANAIKKPKKPLWNPKDIYFCEVPVFKRFIGFMIKIQMLLFVKADKDLAQNTFIFSRMLVESYIYFRFYIYYYTIFYVLYLAESYHRLYFSKVGSCF